MDTSKKGNAMTPEQKEVRTFEVTMTGLQIEALRAYSDLTQPPPCFVDHKHGDFSECDGYATKFQKALYQGFETIFDGWEDAGG